MRWFWTIFCRSSSDSKPKASGIIEANALKKIGPQSKTSDQGTVSDGIAAQTCCQGRVNIAYRGVSDDRLYIAHNRHVTEVKFFRPRGLKVFCIDCRKRLL